MRRSLPEHSKLRSQFKEHAVTTRKIKKKKRGEDKMGRKQKKEGGKEAKRLARKRNEISG